MLKIKTVRNVIFYNFFWRIAKMSIYLQPLWRGTLAQLVEQRTENPCVPGSIPGGTTKKSRNLGLRDFFVFKSIS